MLDNAHGWHVLLGIRAGYRVYAMADLVLKERSISRSFIHGVYMGLGVKVVEMNMSLGSNSNMYSSI